MKLNIKGFTLVELILVIGIIAVLFSVAVVLLDPLGQIQKTNDTRRKSDLSQIQRALETYYQDNNTYPCKGTAGYFIARVCCPTCSGMAWGTSNWDPYMTLLPKDPKSGYTYVYYVSSDRQSYYLYASLERGIKDSQICNSDGSACDSLATFSIPATSCGGTCNYGVTSSDVTP